MLWQAALLALLLLKGRQGQESSNKLKDIDSARWKKQRTSDPDTYEMLTSNLGEKNPSLASNNLSNTFSLNNENLTLYIKAAKLQDSGLYILEVTDESGAVCTIKFNVLIFDHVEKPHLEWRWKILAEEKCEVSLFCLVTRDDNVNYSWYREGKLISTQRNVTYLEELIDANRLYAYTCNVSNAVSWRSHTLSLTQACLSVSLKSTFLPLLLIIIILLALFLGALTCFCMWKRRRQSQTGPKEILIVYEDIKDLQAKSNQELKIPGEESTIYSMIQCQCPAPTSPDSASTLYSVIQTSRKSVSKTKKNHRSSLNCTVYEEVGKRNPKAHNPARLSRKELENFDIYSSM